MNRVAAAMDDQQSPLPSKSDPTENLKRKPEKGILKQSTSFESESASHGQGKKSRQSTVSTTKTMKFDEMNILQTLHPPDKDYGHMKIDEPNTPYEKALPDEADAVDPYDLAEKIRQGEMRKPKVLDQPSSSSEDEDLSDDAKAKRKSFEGRRKQHYNEYQEVQKAKDMIKNEMAELEKEEEEERQRAVRPSHSKTSPRKGPEKKRAFVMKRKAHYNEFLAAKQALQALEDEDEEEE